MGDVVEANFITTLPIPPDRVIEQSAGWGLKEVVIIGCDENGDLRFMSSMPDAGDILYWLEKAKWSLFKIDDQLEANGDPRGKPREC